MPKKLKIWNGGFDGRGDHFYIAAHSVQDAARLMAEANNKIHKSNIYNFSFLVNRNARIIREYFSEGCWGNAMDGITPERGVWYAPAITGGHEGKPERIL